MEEQYRSTVARHTRPAELPGPSWQSAPAAPSRPAVQRGLNLVRRIEHTDDGMVYTEISAFAGGKGWAAQMLPTAPTVRYGKVADYEYRFLRADDRHVSGSGRTGHANYDIRNEDDGVYVAQSVYRSGVSQTVFFEVRDGSVGDWTEDIDEARRWLGATRTLAELDAERRQIERERAKTLAAGLNLPPLVGKSEKQAAYAETVRAKFVGEILARGPAFELLLPGIARATNAPWWLDYARTQKASDVLNALMQLWIEKDPLRASAVVGHSIGMQAVERTVKDGGRDDADARERLAEVAGRLRDPTKAQDILTRVAIGRWTPKLAADALAQAADAFAQAALEEIERWAAENSVNLGQTTGAVE